MTDFAAISEALSSRAEDVCRELLPNGKKVGNEWHVGDVTGSPGDSLKVNLDGQHAGLWKDYAAGTHGDLIDLYQANRGVTNIEAAEWGRRKCGLPEHRNGHHKAEFDPLKLGWKRTGESEWRYGSHAWAYRNSDGSIQGWVVRFPRPDGQKDTIPLHLKPDGKPTWKSWTDTGTLRPLYNLHLLAKKPSHPVLIVEGEKTADAATKLFPNHVCVTWRGGAQAVSKADWTELLNGDRPITVWPDADKPGRDAATYIKSRCPRAKIVRTDDLPEGWDLADSAPDGISLQGMLDGAGAPANTASIATPFRMLGFSNDEYFYLSEASGMVVALTASSHTDLNLNRIAGDDYWQEDYPGRGGPSYKWAAKDLLAAQHRVGFFDPSKLRGVGCWLEGDKVVFHAGDKLYIDGQPVPLHAHRSAYVYPRRAAIRVNLDCPASAADGNALATLCGMLPWRSPDRSWVLAGWLNCAMVCGALPWRPHLWISGGSGSGKSWTYSEIVTPVLGDLALYGQSSTTEAGLRQTLQCDAKPCALDEMEAKDEASMRRVRGNCELSRQASSETGAPILKGSASGDAIHYRCRSSFLFLSIAVGATEQADENRIARMELVESKDEAKFESIKSFWASCVGFPGFCDRIRARAILMAPKLRQAFEIFRVSITRAAKSSRAGQQMGSIAAGYWMLTHDEVPTQAQSDLWVERQDWSSSDNARAEQDENRVMDVLLQSKIVIESDNNIRKSISIGEALYLAINRMGVEGECAKDALDRHGIRPVKGVVQIADRHPELSKIFRHTPYEEKWKEYLGRITGADRRGFFRSAHLDRKFSSTGIHADLMGIKRVQEEMNLPDNPAS